MVIGLDRMAPPDPKLGPRWFPGARLNFAENLLRYADDRPALVFWNERGRQRELSYRGAEPAGSLGWPRRCAATESCAGDRVAGFLPNLPETVIAMLATTSLGAVWSSCSPDFGANGVLDRFGQIRPRFSSVPTATAMPGRRSTRSPGCARCASGFPRSNGWWWSRTSHNGRRSRAIRDASLWADWANRPPVRPSARPPSLRPPALHHVLLRHHRAPQVHGPRRRRDAAAASEGTGAAHRPAARGPDLLLHHLRLDDVELAGLQPGGRRHGGAVRRRAALPAGDPVGHGGAGGVTVFGTSAKYLAMAEKEGLSPGGTHDLGSLRAILSTGSPLAAHSYDYVYRRIKRDVHLASISGGTDIVSCFALGNPIGPVWRGELQTRGLGMSVEVFDPKGRPVQEAEGELVCTRPFPSMPVGVLGRSRTGPSITRPTSSTIPGSGAMATGPDHRARWPGHSGPERCHPQSGGVRIGTAEIYRQVEQLPEVVESLVVGQEWEGDVRIVLFVRLREGQQPGSGPGQPDPTDGSGSTPALTMSPGRSSRWRIFPGPSAAKSPSWRFGTSSTAGRCSMWMLLANPEALQHFRGLEELEDLNQAPRLPAVTFAV